MRKQSLRKGAHLNKGTRGVEAGLSARTARTLAQLTAVTKGLACPVSSHLTRQVVR